MLVAISSLKHINHLSLYSAAPVLLIIYIITDCIDCICITMSQENGKVQEKDCHGAFAVSYFHLLYVFERNTASKLLMRVFPYTVETCISIQDRSVVTSRHIWEVTDTTVTLKPDFTYFFEVI